MGGKLVGDRAGVLKGETMTLRSADVRVDSASKSVTSATFRGSGESLSPKAEESIKSGGVGLY
jgi:hypothetical protein